jgi:hypothetical protein
MYKVAQWNAVIIQQWAEVEYAEKAAIFLPLPDSHLRV